MAITVSITRGVRAVDPYPVLPQLPTVISGAPASVLAAHPKAIIVPAAGFPGPTFVLPLAPVATDADGFAHTLATIERPGTTPLVVSDGLGAKTLTFTCTLRGASRDTSIEDDVIDPLVKLVRSNPRVAIERMGYTERGFWRINGLKLRASARQHGTNHITRASATLSFIEALDYDPQLSAGA